MQPDGGVPTTGGTNVPPVDMASPPDSGNTGGDAGGHTGGELPPLPSCQEPTASPASNALTCSTVALPLGAQDYLASFAFMGDQIIAATHYGDLLSFQPNASNWQSVASFPDVTFSGIVSDGAAFYAVGAAIAPGQPTPWAPFVVGASQSWSRYAVPPSYWAYDATFSGDAVFLGTDSAILQTSKTGDATAYEDVPPAQYRRIRTTSCGELIALGNALGDDGYAANDSLAVRSADSGATWSTFALPSNSVVDLAVGSTTFVAVTRANEIYRSADRGQTWNLVFGPSSSITLNAVASAAPFFAVVASNDVVLASWDDGTTWVEQTVSAPANSTNLSAIGVGSAHRQIVVGGSTDDVVLCSY